MHPRRRASSHCFIFNMALVSPPLPQRPQDVNQQARLKLNRHRPAS